MSFIGVTYVHLTAALGITAISSEYPLSTSGIAYIIEFIVLIALIFIMPAAKPGPYKYMLFALFSIIMGQLLAPLVDDTEKKGILREVLASVAGIFIAMTMVGFTDKQNFLGFGGYLIAALIGLIVARIGLIIAGYVNPDSMDFNKVNNLLSLFATGLFALFVAYDTQKLKEKQRRPYDYVNASLGLFLDIINLFTNSADILSGEVD